MVELALSILLDPSITINASRRFKKIMINEEQNIWFDTELMWEACALAAGVLRFIRQTLQSLTMGEFLLVAQSQDILT